MTKIKHPLSRAERLKLKKDEFESKKERDASKVRRKLYKEQLKLSEAKDALEQYATDSDLGGYPKEFH